ncbi:MAG: DNA-directed RNA polymerase subunit beta', partial [Patescibacteria group bacterium]
MNTKQLPEKIDFNAISLKLASPERVHDWSYGEVTKAETINYRTGRSERGGLFDERIFGPEKDYECYCGKYRRIRYKDIICERCGVEVTRSIVRRERMGHIDLASPVAHIWFLRGVPSRIGLLLNLSIPDLEKVVYFAGYIITGVNESEKERMLKEIDNEFKSRVKNLQDERSKEKLRELASASKKALEEIAPWQVIDEVNYHRLSLKYGSVFEAEIGAEAVYNIFKNLDLKNLLTQVEAAALVARPAERAKIQKRLNLIKSMIKSAIRPEWMFLTVLPVIPPDLRPMVSLEGGRHATSDANDLYRRVINRNNRLKKLKELNAPEVILRNEKRILQEAVDALIDNSIRRSTSSGAMSQAQRRPLKSLSDNLKGKQGRFRQNLLGKRVDYSGRSVIVVGPDLALDECGMPKHMALELFRPFVISEILAQELAYNIRGAGRLIDDQMPEVWEILERVIKNKYVLLNRAPTLHRLGIQAFRPTLIEGSAIQVHPLVCSAFNADFDGDQMAVHLPLSAAAQKEARELMAADKNILKPGNGSPIVNPKLDIVLGLYWVTKLMPAASGAGKAFSSPSEALAAHDFGAVHLRAPIKLLKPANDAKFANLPEELFETSVGRILFNQLLPESLPFINHEVTGRELTKIVDDIIATTGPESVHLVLDRFKDFGFHYATRSGVTWGIDEVVVPQGKAEVIAQTKKEAGEIEDHYRDGLLSKDERYRLLIEVWNGAKSRVEKLLPGSFGRDSSVADMLTSGARGSYSQLGQMSGMKGLVVSLSGRQIEFPIIPSYKEGLSPIEYF